MQTISDPQQPATSPTVTPVAPGPASRALLWAKTPPPWFNKTVAASSVAVLAVGVGVISLGVFDRDDTAGAPTALRPVTPAAVALPAPVPIDLGGQVAPVAFSTADVIGGAVRSAATPPARSTSISAVDSRSARIRTTSGGTLAAPAGTPGAPGADPVSYTHLTLPTKRIV